MNCTLGNSVMHGYLDFINQFKLCKVSCSLNGRVRVMVQLRVRVRVRVRFRG